LLVARRPLSVLPTDVMSKIHCGELHSEPFGRRHSTLQSHGLFALAKRLFHNALDRPTHRPTDRPRESWMTIGRCVPRATRPNNSNLHCLQSHALYNSCRKLACLSVCTSLAGTV